MFPKIAIIYLSFHCEPYIDDVVSAFKNMTYPKDRVAFVVVDNPHPEYGPSARFIEETVMPLSGKGIPQVALLPQKENLGFTGGNNAGIKWALENGFEYVYLHNNDGFMAADCLEKAVETIEADKSVGAVQSLLLMHPETNLINSAGNSFHYLGFGYCGDLRKPKGSIDLNKTREIGYASGAALLLRADLLKQYGLWDEDFFLYHEDLEYSLRLKSLGYKIIMNPSSIFYHKYNFGRNNLKYFFMERNRYGAMLMYFKLPTLLLFLPMAAAMELGMIFFALKSGWIKEKFKAYAYWCRLKNWRMWLAKRRRVQSARRVKDSDLLKSASGVVSFDDKGFNGPVLKYAGNPLMNAYWQIAKRLIFW